MTQTTEIVLHDKLKACQMLCEHLGLLSAELPPLEVLLNRLPPKVSRILRDLLANPAASRPKPIDESPGEHDGPKPENADAR